MITTKCDGKGRIYLREALRAKYGERFLVVEGPNELRLLPRPQDPVADLAEIGRDLPDVKPAMFKASIRRRALAEAVR